MGSNNGSTGYTLLEEKENAQYSVFEQKVEEYALDPSQSLPDYSNGNDLGKGIQVPTKSRRITSGFEYPAALAEHGVSEAEWKSCIQELSETVKLSPTQWVLTIGRGAGIVILTGFFSGWLSLIPATLVVNHVRARNERSNLIKAERSGELALKEAQWNEEIFKPRGLFIRVDLPGDTRDIDEMDVTSTKLYRSKHDPQEGSSRLAALLPKTSSPEKKIEKAMKDEGKARKGAIKKGRIVIMPLDEVDNHKGESGY